MRTFQILEEASRPPEQRNASTVSTNALGIREIQRTEEADRPLDYAKLKCVGTMAEVWEGMLMLESKKWML